MMITLYGIRNCDTMKKARQWLDGHRVEHAFHDYKTAGIDRTTLEKWLQHVDWTMLLNRAGTTFRKLPQDERQDLTVEKAINLMCRQPSMIKRPVIDTGRQLVVGFSPAGYAELFASL